MGLLLLEALLALAILVFIVWWTLFSGRRNGERRTDASVDADVPADVDGAPGGGRRGPPPH